MQLKNSTCHYCKIDFRKNKWAFNEKYANHAGMNCFNCKHYYEIENRDKTDPYASWNKPNKTELDDTDWPESIKLPNGKCTGSYEVITRNDGKYGGIYWQGKWILRGWVSIDNIKTEVNIV